MIVATTGTIEVVWEYQTMFLNRTSSGFVLSVETLYGKMFYNDTIAIM